jgi:hypothetical protein
MNIKTLFCAIAAAAVVVGCGSPHGIKPLDGTSVMSCPGASCDVIVYVSGDLSTGTPPVVAVSAEDLHVPRGNSPTITWKLQAPGYEFRRDSITPHTTAATPSKMTTSQSDWDAQITFLNNTADRFMVKDINRSPGKLFYNVRVYNTRTGTAYNLDPVIFNDF